RATRAVWAVWDVIAGRRCRTGAASSDRGPTGRTDRNGIPSALPLVRGVWSANPSAVASDDAHREFWAAPASDGRLLGGPDRRESTRSAGYLSDAVSDGGERRGDWSIRTSGEYRLSHPRAGRRTVCPAPAGTQCR